MGKNFVFISPTFPKTYYQFPQAWKRIGGTSLCIGEDYYDSLSEEMKNACDEYYRVDNMQDYDQMYRAVAWFAHKHGKIDWLQNYVRISISLLVTTKLLSCAIKQNQT